MSTGSGSKMPSKKARALLDALRKLPRSSETPKDVDSDFKSIPKSTNPEDRKRLQYWEDFKDHLASKDHDHLRKWEPELEKLPDFRGLSLAEKSAKLDKLMYQMQEQAGLSRSDLTEIFTGGNAGQVRNLMNKLMQENPKLRDGVGSIAPGAGLPDLTSQQRAMQSPDRPKLTNKDLIHGEERARRLMRLSADDRRRLAVKYISRFSTRQGSSAFADVQSDFEMGHEEEKVHMEALSDMMRSELGSSGAVKQLRESGETATASELVDAQMLDKSMSDILETVVQEASESVEEHNVDGEKAASKLPGLKDRAVRNFVKSLSATEVETRMTDLDVWYALKVMYGLPTKSERSALLWKQEADARDMHEAKFERHLLNRSRMQQARDRGNEELHRSGELPGSIFRSKWNKAVHAAAERSEKVSADKSAGGDSGVADAVAGGPSGSARKGIDQMDFEAQRDEARRETEKQRDGKPATDAHVTAEGKSKTPFAESEEFPDATDKHKMKSLLTDNDIDRIRAYFGGEIPSQEMEKLAKLQSVPDFQNFGDVMKYCNDVGAPELAAHMYRMIPWQAPKVRRGNPAPLRLKRAFQDRFPPRADHSSASDFYFPPFFASLDALMNRLENEHIFADYWQLVRSLGVETATELANEARGKMLQSILERTPGGAAALRTPADRDIDELETAEMKAEEEPTTEEKMLAENLQSHMQEEKNSSSKSDPALERWLDVERPRSGVQSTPLNEFIPSAELRYLSSITRLGDSFKPLARWRCMYLRPHSTPALAEMVGLLELGVHPSDLFVVPPAYGYNQMLAHGLNNTHRVPSQNVLPLEQYTLESSYEVARVQQVARALTQVGLQVRANRSRDMSPAEQHEKLLLVDEGAYASVALGILRGEFSVADALAIVNPTLLKLPFSALYPAFDRSLQLLELRAKEDWEKNPTEGSVYLDEDSRANDRSRNFFSLMEGPKTFAGIGSSFLMEPSNEFDRIQDLQTPITDRFPYNDVRRLRTWAPAPNDPVDERFLHSRDPVAVSKLLGIPIDEFHLVREWLLGASQQEILSEGLRGTDKDAPLKLAVVEADSRGEERYRHHAALRLMAALHVGTRVQGHGDIRKLFEAGLTPDDLVTTPRRMSMPVVCASAGQANRANRGPLSSAAAVSQWDALEQIAGTASAALPQSDYRYWRALMWGYSPEQRHVAKALWDTRLVRPDESKRGVGALSEDGHEFYTRPFILRKNLYVWDWDPKRRAQAVADGLKVLTARQVLGLDPLPFRVKGATRGKAWDSMYTKDGDETARMVESLISEWDGGDLLEDGEDGKQSGELTEAASVETDISQETDVTPLGTLFEKTESSTVEKMLRGEEVTPVGGDGVAGAIGEATSALSAPDSLPDALMDGHIDSRSDPIIRAQYRTALQARQKRKRDALATAGGGRLQKHTDRIQYDKMFSSDTGFDAILSGINGMGDSLCNGAAPVVYDGVKEELSKYAGDQIATDTRSEHIYTLNAPFGTQFYHLLNHEAVLLNTSTAEGSDFQVPAMVDLCGLYEDHVVAQQDADALWEKQYWEQFEREIDARKAKEGDGAAEGGSNDVVDASDSSSEAKVSVGPSNAESGRVPVNLTWTNSALPGNRVVRLHSTHSQVFGEIDCHQNLTAQYQLVKQDPTLVHARPEETAQQTAQAIDLHSNIHSAFDFERAVYRLIRGSDGRYGPKDYAEPSSGEVSGEGSGEGSGKSGEKSLVPPDATGLDGKSKPFLGKLSFLDRVFLSERTFRKVHMANGGFPLMHAHKSVPVLPEKHLPETLSVIAGAVSAVQAREALSKAPWALHQYLDQQLPKHEGKSGLHLDPDGTFHGVQLSHESGFSKKNKAGSLFSSSEEESAQLTDEQVQTSLDQLKLRSLVATLPSGVDTYIASLWMTLLKQGSWLNPPSPEQTLAAAEVAAEPGVDDKWVAMQAKKACNWLDSQEFELPPVEYSGDALEVYQGKEAGRDWIVQQLKSRIARLQLRGVPVSSDGGSSSSLNRSALDMAVDNANGTSETTELSDENLLGELVQAMERLRDFSPEMVSACPIDLGAKSPSVDGSADIPAVTSATARDTDDLANPMNPLFINPNDPYMSDDMAKELAERRRRNREQSVQEEIAEMMLSNRCSWEEAEDLYVREKIIESGSEQGQKDLARVQARETLSGEREYLKTGVARPYMREDLGEEKKDQEAPKIEESKTEDAVDKDQWKKSLLETMNRRDQNEKQSTNYKWELGKPYVPAKDLLECVENDGDSEDVKQQKRSKLKEKQGLAAETYRRARQRFFEIVNSGKMDSQDSLPNPSQDLVRAKVEYLRNLTSPDDEEPPEGGEQDPQLSAEVQQKLMESMESGDYNRLTDDELPKELVELRHRLQGEKSEMHADKDILSSQESASFGELLGLLAEKAPHLHEKMLLGQEISPEEISQHLSPADMSKIYAHRAVSEPSVSAGDVPDEEIRPSTQEELMAKMGQTAPKWDEFEMESFEIDERGSQKADFDLDTSSSSDRVESAVTDVLDGVITEESSSSTSDVVDVHADDVEVTSGSATQDAMFEEFLKSSGSNQVPTPDASASTVIYSSRSPEADENVHDMDFDWGDYDDVEAPADEASLYDEPTPQDTLGSSGELSNEQWSELAHLVSQDPESNPEAKRVIGQVAEDFGIDQEQVPQFFNMMLEDGGKIVDLERGKVIDRADGAQTLAAAATGEDHEDFGAGSMYGGVFDEDDLDDEERFELELQKRRQNTSSGTSFADFDFRDEDEKDVYDAVNAMLPGARLPKPVADTDLSVLESELVEIGSGPDIGLAERGISVSVDEKTGERVYTSARGLTVLESELPQLLGQKDSKGNDVVVVDKQREAALLRLMKTKMSDRKSVAADDDIEILKRDLDEDGDKVHVILPKETEEEIRAKRRHRQPEV